MKVGYDDDLVSNSYVDRINSRPVGYKILHIHIYFLISAMVIFWFYGENLVNFPYSLRNLNNTRYSLFIAHKIKNSQFSTSPVTQKVESPMSIFIKISLHVFYFHSRTQKLLITTTWKNAGIESQLSRAIV